MFVGDFFVHLPATNVVKLTIIKRRRGAFSESTLRAWLGALPEWIENMSRANLRLFVLVFL